jgi:phosphonate transport system substrate-binding protein
MTASSLARVGLICALLTAFACDKKTEANGSTETTATTSTSATETTAEAPEAPATPKYVIAFEPQQDRDATREKGEALAEYLSKKTGEKIGVYIPKESGEVVEALQDKKAHIAYLSAWPYVAAHLNADATLLLAEERDGKTTYETAFFVKADSDMKSTKDVAGKKIAFTTPTSTSGYLFPMMKLIEDGVVARDDDLAETVDEIVLTGGYRASLQAVLDGKVDVAAVAAYAPEVYLDEEARKGLKVLTTFGPVPTHGIAVRADVPLPEQEKLKKAFLTLNDGEGKQLLTDVYGAEKLVERSHGDHVYKLQQELERLEVEYPLD